MLRSLSLLRLRTDATIVYAFGLDPRLSIFFYNSFNSAPLAVDALLFPFSVWLSFCLRLSTHYLQIFCQLVCSWRPYPFGWFAFMCLHLSVQKTHLILKDSTLYRLAGQSCLLMLFMAADCIELGGSTPLA